MKAAENGNMDNCITLLRNACDPFIRDSKGRTADIFAEINHSDPQLIEILRQYMEALNQENSSLAN